MGFQTEYFRNSSMGQWRYYKLEKEMTPQTIDWKRWLGVSAGLAPEMDFDRAVYAQWRCYWPFGSGMLTDLFVHRTTAMLKATGLRYPARVVGAGGIYLELDTREVPDVATVVADYNEGCQGLISSTMCNENSRLKQVIRGHNGAFEFGNGEQFTEFKFVAERPQVTFNADIKDEVIKTDLAEEDLKKNDTTYFHFKNWLDALVAGDPEMCNNTPDLGAAAASKREKAPIARVISDDATLVKRWIDQSPKSIDQSSPKKGYGHKSIGRKHNANISLLRDFLTLSDAAEAYAINEESVFFKQARMVNTKQWREI
jgi:hypothetical protein